MDVQPDVLTARERDEAHAGMLDEFVADRAAGSRDEIDDVGRQTAVYQQVDEARGDDGRIARRLEDDGVSRDDCSGRHPHHDREGEIPWWNDDARAERYVKHFV